MFGRRSWIFPGKNHAKQRTNDESHYHHCEQWWHKSKYWLTSPWVSSMYRSSFTSHISFIMIRVKCNKPLVYSRSPTCSLRFEFYSKLCINDAKARRANDVFWKCRGPCCIAGFPCRDQISNQLTTAWQLGRIKRMCWSHVDPRPPPAHTTVLLFKRPF